MGYPKEDPGKQIQTDTVSVQVNLALVIMDTQANDNETMVQGNVMEGVAQAEPAAVESSSEPQQTPALQPVEAGAANVSAPGPR